MLVRWGNTPATLMLPPSKTTLDSSLVYLRGTVLPSHSDRSIQTLRSLTPCAITPLHHRDNDRFDEIGVLATLYPPQELSHERASPTRPLSGISVLRCGIQVFPVVLWRQRDVPSHGSETELPQIRPQSRQQLLRVQTLLVPRGNTMDCECGPEIIEPRLKATTIESNDTRITTNHSKLPAQRRTVHRRTVPG